MSRSACKCAAVSRVVALAITSLTLMRSLMVEVVDWERLEEVNADAIVPEHALIERARRGRVIIVIVILTKSSYFLGRLCSRQLFHLVSLFLRFMSADMKH